jgi:hypothetical protein
MGRGVQTLKPLTRDRLTAQSGWQGSGASVDTEVERRYLSTECGSRRTGGRTRQRTAPGADGRLPSAARVVRSSGLIVFMDLRNNRLRRLRGTALRMNTRLVSHKIAKSIPVLL